MTFKAPKVSIMMFLRVILLVFLFICRTQTAAATEWVEVKKIQVIGNQICLDNLSNFYVYNERVIEKYNSQGKLLFTFSSTTASDISKIDVLNPLRILVFYKDISQIRFLDNTLSDLGIELNLSDLEFQQTSLVCNSANKGLWLFNPQNIELIHLNNDLEIISKSGNLSVLLKENFNPTQLLEFNNQLYLCNNNSVYVFDNFGTYLKHIPTKCENCIINESAIITCSSDTIETYSFKDKSISILVSVRDESSKLFNGNTLFSLNKNGGLVLYEKK